MELPLETKKQLMKLAGITDVSEFDEMAKKVASSSASHKNKSGENQSDVRRNVKMSPFQVHFVKMRAMVEAEGMDKFVAMNDRVQAQVEHVLRIISEDPEYTDMSAFVGQLNPTAATNCAAAAAHDDDELIKESKIELSKTFRDRGNKAYSKKDWNNAIALYSQSLLSGPLNYKEASGGREAALALGNRSAVFFETKQFRRCMDDINAAIKYFGYPQELEYKLLERQAKTHLEMGKADKAKLAFRRAAEAVQRSNMAVEKKMSFAKEQELKAGQIKSNSRKDYVEEAEEEEDWKKCPYTIWETNPVFPPLSDSLGIAYSEEGGRHVIAKKNIQAGEPVVIEEPVSSHLSPCYLHTNCVHCLRRTAKSVLPSLLVAKARFCSLSCLETAMSSYHRVESQIDITDLFYNRDSETQMSGCISLAYRAITQKPVNFFVDNRDQLFDKHDIKFGLENPPGFAYKGNQHYKGLYNLVNHIEHTNKEERLSIVVRTAVLLKCLIAAGYFGPTELGSSSLTSDQLYIGELLFHFQTGIQYNLHAVYQVSEKDLTPGKRIPLSDIGAGVYPTTIFFNHSCAPNTVRINQGKRVVYVAKRNISAGDQVTDCYGIHHLSVTLADRQAALERGYAFTCTCVACKNNFGTLADLPSTISPNVAVKLGNTMSKYKNLFNEGKIEKALSACQEYLGRLEELEIRYPHLNYELAAVALCSCLWAIASRKNC